MIVKNFRCYKIEYEEVRKKNSFLGGYVPQIKIYKDGELLLSSEGKEKEEFFNYLSFLVSEDTFRFVNELYDNWGSTEEEIALRDIDDYDF